MGHMQVRAAYGYVDASDRSMWLLPRQHPMRQWFLWLVGTQQFKLVVMLLVLANVALMGADDPRCDDECAQHDPRKKALAVLDICFTACFTLDVACQVRGSGVAMCSTWHRAVETAGPHHMA